MNNYWILPCNIDYYDVLSAFENLNIINWKQAINDIKPGDIAYIYIGNKIKRIMYKCKIISINLKKLEIDDRDFVIDAEQYENSSRYMTLEKICCYDNDINALKYSELKKHGLSTVQGQNLITKELKEYIKRIEKEMFSKTEIDILIENFIRKNNINEYNNSIKKLEHEREEFVNKFTVENILNMKLDDYVIGRSTIEENGKKSFCYLIETKFKDFGEMRGGFVSKFGVWYNKERKYLFTKKYGNNLEDAFDTLKHQIEKLIIDGGNKNYSAIEKNLISPLFKGKILSMYYPEEYLCIFNEIDIEILLKELNIYYDANKIKLLEQKKELLKKFKDNNKLMKNTKNSYYIKFLYDTFMHKLIEKRNNDEINGEIAYYNLEKVEFKYLGEHIKKNNNFKKGKADYKKRYENQKAVGDKGENAILNYEKNILLKNGYEKLSQDVYIVKDDSLGYDILSYDYNGNKKYIEVKTKSGKMNFLDFYLTDNELEKFKNKDNYYIYYLFDIKSNNPKFTIINKNDLLENEKKYLKPVLYKVQIDVEELKK